jgi:tetratricopeptide (TPR) repeat protein
MPETDDPRAVWAWFRHDICGGEYQEALDRLFASSVADADFFYPKPLLSAQVYELLNEPQLARSAYDAARIVLETEIRARPDDFRLHSALGITLAGLGRKDEAILEGKRAVELYPVSKDTLAGTRPVIDLALTYTMVGEHDAALDRIEYLLSIPSLVSVPLLRLDPRWAPLRDHPRFKELEKRFG